MTNYPQIIIILFCSRFHEWLKWLNSSLRTFTSLQSEMLTGTADIRNGSPTWLGQLRALLGLWICVPNFGFPSLRISRCSDFLHNSCFHQSRHSKSMLGSHRLQVLLLSTGYKQVSKFNKKGHKHDLVMGIMPRNL